MEERKKSNLSDDIILGKISEILGELASGKCAHEEVPTKIETIKQCYEKLHGPRYQWGAELRKTVDGIETSTNLFYARQEFLRERI